MANKKLKTWFDTASSMLERETAEQVYRCLWLCISLHVLDAGEEILFIFVFVKERFIGREKHFPVSHDLLFPLCVFVCVVREESSWYTCLQLKCQDGCFKFHWFFCHIGLTECQSFAQWNYFKKYLLDIYILKLLFSVKKHVNLL